jgi:proline iminopeptidase
LIAAYYRRLTSPHAGVRLEAAKAWSIWEASTSKLFLDPNLQQKFGDSQFADAFARIECHHFVNKGFLKTEDPVIERMRSHPPHPTVIIQGRYDVVCPMISAWELHQAFPEAEFVVVPDGSSEFAVKIVLNDTKL